MNPSPGPAGGDDRSEAPDGEAPEGEVTDGRVGQGSAGPGSPPARTVNEGAALAHALARTHEWFESHSGWAPPDQGTLVDLAAEGLGRAPDECLVAERGVCRHGLVSWQVVLDDLAESDQRARAPRSGP